ncbi:MAG: hypothetical protein J6Q32_00190 [Clostridia bacterium]|nr:hypothetical protein [Clostridia bacterium]
MFRIYEENSYDLTDKIEFFANGKKVSVRECYTSVYPINARWPGRQRHESQRQINYFASLEGDEELDCIIKLPFEIKSVRLKPYEKSEEPCFKDRELSFKIKNNGGYVVLINDYRFAIHIFYNKIGNYSDQNYENVLYFGKGEHDVGILNLESNQTVFIDEGAVVYGCIHVRDCENINIIGKGTLDNSKNKERILYEMPYTFGDRAFNNAERDFTIRLEFCKNINISGIIIKDSLAYNLATYGCDKVEIDGINIIGCWRYNTDGVCLHGSSNVVVKNCFIRSFDDGVYVRGLDDVEGESNSYNVLVDNCVIFNDWNNALHVGVLSGAKEIKNVVFQNCYVLFGASAVFDVTNTDDMEIHDIKFDNISVEFEKDNPIPLIQKEHPFVIPNVDETKTHKPKPFAFLNMLHHEYTKSGTNLGKIFNVEFKNIRFYAPTDVYGSSIIGDEKEKIKNVYFKNIFWNGNKISDLNGLNIEIINSENIVIE